MFVCFVLYCFVLYCFVVYCFVLFCIVLFGFVLYCFVLFDVLFCHVLYCLVLFCFVLFWFVLYCFVLFCICLGWFGLVCFVLFCFVLSCFVLFWFVLFGLIWFGLFCLVLFCLVLPCFVWFCFVCWLVCWRLLFYVRCLVAALWRGFTVIGSILKSSRPTCSITHCRCMLTVCYTVRKVTHVILKWHIYDFDTLYERWHILILKGYCTIRLKWNDVKRFCPPKSAVVAPWWLSWNPSIATKKMQIVRLWNEIHVRVISLPLTEVKMNSNGDPALKV